MTTVEIFCQCEHCKKPYTKEQTVGLGLSGLYYPYDEARNTRTLELQCLECKGRFPIAIRDEHYQPFREALELLQEAQEESLDRAIDAYVDTVPDVYEEQDHHKKSEAEHTDKIDEDKINTFQEAIKNIDKNLSPLELSRKIVEALEIIIDVSPSDVEACFKIIKGEFKLIARDIEAFRKGLNNKRAQIAKDKDKKRYNDLVARLSQPPKELSEAEKQEATAYLKHPELINNILRDVSYAGEVVREETNIMMLYLSAISRKLDKPISLVIFGKSSTGKSYLANAIEDFVPPEDMLTITSSSARALDYMGDQLKHKCILIQEWEGMEAIMGTIRVLQSEGRISRAVSIKDPETESRKTVAIDQKCPCSVVVTTTKENIHNENSTRIFELYADDSIPQTEKVVDITLKKGSLKYQVNPSEKKRIMELHHNVQRMLEPFEIDIPFAEHLTFPAKTARHRRDSARFVQLIKTVAFLRQKQKVVKTMNGISYIEADLYDYEVAYRIGIDVIKKTLDQISDRARNVLRVCCELADEFIKSGQHHFFTVSQIQEMAPKLNLDFGNRPDLYKQLNKLTEYEYLELHQTHNRGKKSYSVCFDYVRDQSGKIINIDAPGIHEITTPFKLREKTVNI